MVRKMIGRPRPQDGPYLAPEVFRGEPFSRPTDVYAFGLLMWELYTGQPAFASFANTPLKVGGLRRAAAAGPPGRRARGLGHGPAAQCAAAAATPRQPRAHAACLPAGAADCGV
jgi:hypothetical protein